MRLLKNSRKHLDMTPAEKDVYDLRVFGYDNREAAFFLGKSPATVAFQFGVAREKAIALGWPVDYGKSYGYNSVKRAKGKVMMAHG